MKIPVNVHRRARQCRVTQGLSKFQRSLAYTSRYNTLHYFQRVLQDGTLALVVMINYHRCNIIDIFVLLAFKSARIVLLQLQPELHSRSHVQRLTTFDGWSIAWTHRSYGVVELSEGAFKLFLPTGWIFNRAIFSKRQNSVDAFKIRKNQLFKQDFSANFVLIRITMSENIFLGKENEWWESGQCALFVILWSFWIYSETLDTRQFGKLFSTAVLIVFCCFVSFQ